MVVFVEIGNVMMLTCSIGGHDVTVATAELGSG
jgi:hypothetical protein